MKLRLGAGVLACDSYVRDACRQGARVTYARYANASHTTVVKRAAAAAVNWMADRLAGKAARSNCGDLGT